MSDEVEKILKHFIVPLGEEISELKKSQNKMTEVLSEFTSIKTQVNSLAATITRLNETIDGKLDNKVSQREFDTMKKYLYERIANVEKSSLEKLETHDATSNRILLTFEKIYDGKLATIYKILWWVGTTAIGGMGLVIYDLVTGK